MSRPPRMVLTKAGLDAHERGIHVLKLGLRDAGMEVIYTGLRAKVNDVAVIARDEDVDVIGVSSLAGGHLSFVRRLRSVLDELSVDPVVVVGGVIPADDHDALRSLGVRAIYGPGTSIAEIAQDLKQMVGDKRAEGEHE